MASSLLLSSASRAFSFLICSVSLLTRKDAFLSCSVSLSSCFVRCREALICLSMSGLCRQLSVCNHKRHRGNDEPHAPLLLELEVDACWEGDVVIGTEQGNQGNHTAGMSLDDSLAIKPRAALGRIRAFSQGWLRFGWWNDLRQGQKPDKLCSWYRNTTFNARWCLAARTQQSEGPWRLFGTVENSVQLAQSLSRCRARLQGYQPNQDAMPTKPADQPEEPGANRTVDLTQARGSRPRPPKPDSCRHAISPGTPQRRAPPHTDPASQRRGPQRQASPSGRVATRR
jgi:hypothetical protein